MVSGVRRSDHLEPKPLLGADDREALHRGDEGRPAVC